LIDELLVVIDAGQPLTRDAVERAIAMLRARTAERPADVLTINIISNRGRTIRPKTLGQKRYVDAIDRTRSSSGSARPAPARPTWRWPRRSQALQSQAGQPDHPHPPGGRGGRAAGFLPGTLSDKIDPYLRPLYDALHDMVDPDRSRG
jgi:phosphate starvation-inducible PhoH-like protein